MRGRIEVKVVRVGPSKQAQAHYRPFEGELGKGNSLGIRSLA